MDTTNPLFSPYQLGNIELQNRMVMAPMTRCRAINNVPSPLMAEYYGQRASAGLIIAEGTSPSPNGLGYARIPGLFNEEQVEGWKLVTNAVRKRNGRIFLQIMHTGRVSHIENMPKGARVLGPSEKVVSGEMYTDNSGNQPHSKPEQMSVSDIKEAVDEYIESAKKAIEAGFDGVEIHGANGYLIEQFINPNVNNRTDSYGGSAENNGRFLVEIVQGIASAIGKEKTGLRLSPYGVFNDTGAFDGIEEAYSHIAEEMEKIGIIYIHLVDHAAMGAPEVPQSIKTLIREKYSGTIILSGGYNMQQAEKDLSENKGELIAFGRPYISNPDLVKAFKDGKLLKEPDFNTFYTPGQEGYTDY